MSYVRDVAHLPLTHKSKHRRFTFFWTGDRIEDAPIGNPVNDFTIVKGNLVGRRLPTPTETFYF